MATHHGLCLYQACSNNLVVLVLPDRTAGPGRGSKGNRCTDMDVNDWVLLAPTAAVVLQTALNDMLLREAVPPRVGIVGGVGYGRIHNNDTWEHRRT